MGQGPLAPIDLDAFDSVLALYASATGAGAITATITHADDGLLWVVTHALCRADQAADLTLNTTIGGTSRDLDAGVAVVAWVPLKVQSRIIVESGGSVYAWANAVASKTLHLSIHGYKVAI